MTAQHATSYPLVADAGSRVGRAELEPASGTQKRAAQPFHILLEGFRTSNAWHPSWVTSFISFLDPNFKGGLFVGGWSV